MWGGAGVDCSSLHINSFQWSCRFQTILVTILAGFLQLLKKTDSKIYKEIYKGLKEPIDFWKRMKLEDLHYVIDPAPS